MASWLYVRPFSVGCGGMCIDFQSISGLGLQAAVVPLYHITGSTSHNCNSDCFAGIHYKQSTTVSWCQLGKVCINDCSHNTSQRSVLVEVETTLRISAAILYYAHYVGDSKCIRLFLCILYIASYTCKATCGRTTIRTTTGCPSSGSMYAAARHVLVPAEHNTENAHAF